MKKNRILIITGGSFSYDFISEYLLEETFDYTIAVDRGLIVADKLDIKVDYLLGDFDSVSQEVLNKYKTSKELGVNIMEFQPEKDATDTELALDLASTLNPSEIILLGATGTRLDHVLANIYLLKKTLELNIKTSILDDHNCIYLINKDTKVKRKQSFGDYYSILPYGSATENVTLEGFKYPLNNHHMTMGDSLGISNELISEEGWIRLSFGTLIIIESRD